MVSCQPDVASRNLKALSDCYSGKCTRAMRRLLDLPIRDKDGNMVAVPVQMYVPASRAVARKYQEVRARQIEASTGKPYVPHLSIEERIQRLENAILNNGKVTRNDVSMSGVASLPDATTIEIGA